MLSKANTVEKTISKSIDLKAKQIQEVTAKIKEAEKQIHLLNQQSQKVCDSRYALETRNIKALQKHLEGTNVKVDARVFEIVPRKENEMKHLQIEKDFVTNVRQAIEDGNFRLIEKLAKKYEQTDTYKLAVENGVDYFTKKELYRCQQEEHGELTFTFPENRPNMKFMCCVCSKADNNSSWYCTQCKPSYNVCLTCRPAEGKRREALEIYKHHQEFRKLEEALNSKVVALKKVVFEKNHNLDDINSLKRQVVEIQAQLERIVRVRDKLTDEKETFLYTKL